MYYWNSDSKKKPVQNQAKKSKSKPKAKKDN